MKKLLFVINQIFPEARVGSDQRSPLFHKAVGIQKGHSLILHEIRNDEGCRSEYRKFTLQCRFLRHHKKVHTKRESDMSVSVFTGH